MSEQRASACRGIAVAVPAHNEELDVAACLTSIAQATAHLRAVDPSVAVVTVLVADDCTDATVARSANLGAEVVTTHDRSVGTARRVGVARALARLDEFGVDRRDVWIATTDADSVVPPNWLIEAVRAHRAGADAVVGTVRPDFSGLPAGYRDHWRSTHPSGRPNGHVHGANLGVRASVLDAVGSFSELRTGEDVELIARVRAAGFDVRASDAAEVVTSARLVGRAPSGYAAFLAADLAEWAARRSA